MIPGSPLWRWLERVLFLVGLLVLVHPVTSNAYYFTVDGPSHAYTASLLATQWSDTERLWELSPYPVPNWTGHALLGALHPLVGPVGALKVLHLLLLLALPIAIRALAIQRRQPTLWTAHLAIPFAVSTMFSMGYYNFCLGLALMVAVMLVRERTGSNGSWIALAFLLIALYFTHLLPFGVALLYLAVQELVLLPWKEKRVPSVSDLRAVVPATLCALPSVMLLGLYLWKTPEEMIPHGAQQDRWALWRPFTITGSTSEPVLWGAVIMCILLVFALRRGNEGPGSPAGQDVLDRGRWVQRIFMIIMLLLLAFIPDELGQGSDTVVRIMIIAQIWFLTTLPSVEGNPWPGVWISTTAILITATWQFVRRPDHHNLTTYLRHSTELAERVPPNSRVVTFHFNWWEAHTFDLGLSEARAIDLSNYELIHHHFPIRWRPETLSGWADLPDDPLDALFQRTGVRGALIRQADIILVAGHPYDDDTRAETDLLCSELAGSHQLGPSVGDAWSLIPNSRSPWPESTPQ